MTYEPTAEDRRRALQALEAAAYRARFAGVTVEDIRRATDTGTSDADADLRALGRAA